MTSGTELEILGDEIGCSSQGHIRSQGEHVVGEIVPAKVEVYPNATFAKVVRELVWKKCRDCGRMFKAEMWKSYKSVRCSNCFHVTRECKHCGSEFAVTNGELRRNETVTCPYCQGENEGIKRGEVTRFSEDSKRRLMQLLNKVTKDLRNVSFVTLTYADTFHAHRNEPARWKSDLRKFEHRFRRAFPGGTFVWRLEVTDRKSGDYTGEVFPHFHLLVFNVHIGKLRPFVAEHWHEIAGNGSAQHLAVHAHRDTVTPVISRRGVMSYAAKAVGSVMSRELAKDLQANGTNVGRWWGVAVRKVFSLFLDEPETYEITDRDAVQYLRLFRKYIQSQSINRWKQAGKRWKKPNLKGFTFRSLSVFLDGEWLSRNLLRVVTSQGRWAFSSTGRNYNEPFWKWAYRNGKLEPVLETI